MEIAEQPQAEGPQWCNLCLTAAQPDVTGAGSASAGRQFQADERTYRVETASSFTLTSQSKEPETWRPEVHMAPAAMRTPEADPQRRATNGAPVVEIALAALILLLLWALFPSPTPPLPFQPPSPPAPSRPSTP